MVLVKKFFYGLVGWFHRDPLVPNDPINYQQRYLNTACCYLILWLMSILLLNFVGAFTKASPFTWLNVLKNFLTFSEQTNVLALILVLCYFCAPKAQVFHTNYFCVIVFSYLMTIMIGYCLVLGPQSRFNTWTNWTNVHARINATKSIANHLINPILIITYFLYLIRTANCWVLPHKWKGNSSKVRLFIYGCLWPLIFMIYAAILSLTNTAVIYNHFSNLNVHLGYSKTAPYHLVVLRTNQADFYHDWNYRQLAHTVSLQPMSAATQQLLKQYTFGKVSNLSYFLLLIVIINLCMISIWFVINYLVKQVSAQCSIVH